MIYDPEILNFVSDREIGDLILILRSDNEIVTVIEVIDSRPIATSWTQTSVDEIVKWSTDR